MPSAAMNRFDKRYLPIANGIASADIDQEARELVARTVADAIKEVGARHMPDFKHDLFVLLASDPLVPCAGTKDGPCPHGRVIRIAMHLSNAPDGRSAAWEQRAPYGRIRCVTCGAAEFIPGFSDSENPD